MWALRVTTTGHHVLKWFRTRNRAMVYYRQRRRADGLNQRIILEIFETGLKLARICGPHL